MLDSLEMSGSCQWRFLAGVVSVLSLVDVQAEESTSCLGLSALPYAGCSNRKFHFEDLQCHRVDVILKEHSRFSQQAIVDRRVIGSHYVLLDFHAKE